MDSKSDTTNKPKAGILRLDIKKSHNRTSGGSSVEFRSSPEVLGCVSKDDKDFFIYICI